MLCMNCRTGKELYKLDSSEPMCPYMQGYVNGSCMYYVPYDEEKNDDKNAGDDDHIVP